MIINRATPSLDKSLHEKTPSTTLETIKPSFQSFFTKETFLLRNKLFVFSHDSFHIITDIINEIQVLKTNFQ